MTNQCVVIQLREDADDAIFSATRAAKNLLAEIPDATVELVVQGGAVSGLTRGADQAGKLREILTGMPQLIVVACANALAAHDVTEADLAEGIQVTPAGVAHVARRQWEGWAYLRA